jgi:ankyrin repeat protein
VTNGAEVNKKLGGDGSALLIASREGSLETVKYLISHGADVNGQVDGDGTPLICSVRNGHYEISRVLLENGADPYLVSPGDEYAMFHARMSKNKSIIDLLKKYERDN